MGRQSEASERHCCKLHAINIYAACMHFASYTAAMTAALIHAESYRLSRAPNRYGHQPDIELGVLLLGFESSLIS